MKRAEIECASSKECVLRARPFTSNEETDKSRLCAPHGAASGPVASPTGANHPSADKRSDHALRKPDKLTSWNIAKLYLLKVTGWSPRARSFVMEAESLPSENVNLALDSNDRAGFTHRWKRLSASIYCDPALVCGRSPQA